MSKVALELPDKAKVIALFGGVYNDPRVALAEFIVNGMDAGAHVIRIIPKSGKVNSVTILDDGIGMAETEMRRVVTNIANSIKTDAEELKKKSIDPAHVIGKMGIGILGYQSFARKVTFISKTEGSNSLWRLTLERGEQDAEIAPALPYERGLVAGLPHGTEVELTDIPREVMRLFSRERLCQYLQSNFAVLLRREDAATIFVNDQQVMPPPPDGTPFSVRRLPVGNLGEVEVCISIVAGGVKDGVALASRGRVVEKEIIRLPEFQCSPWVDGVLHGTLEAPFLSVAPTRSSYNQDAAFREFVEAMHGIEEPLRCEIEAAQKKRSQQQQSDALLKLREAMGHALHDLELEASRLRSRSVGGVIPADVATDAQHETKAPNAESQNATRPNKVPNETGMQRPGHSQLNLEWRKLGTAVHSQLGEGGMIIINEDCPDFKEECMDMASVRTLRYLTKIASKELAKRNFESADSDEVMERAIEIELRALRYMDLPIRRA